VARVQLERAAKRFLVTARRQLIGLRGHQRVEEALDLGGRKRARELGRHAPIPEGLHRRDALDPEAGRERGVRVDVDLGQVDLAIPALRGQLERGSQLPAGCAPVGPEVDHDRQLLRALDDFLLEIGLGGVDDRHRVLG
jgi:hypothetical protein